MSCDGFRSIASANMFSRSVNLVETWSTGVKRAVLPVFRILRSHLNCQRGHYHGLWSFPPYLGLKSDLWAGCRRASCRKHLKRSELHQCIAFILSVCAAKEHRHLSIGTDGSWMSAPKIRRPSCRRAGAELAAHIRVRCYDRPNCQ